MKTVGFGQVGITYNDYDPVDSAKGYDIAIIGCPSDAGSTARGGQRSGPQAIRDAAAWDWDEMIDHHTKTTMNLKVCDLGDVAPRHSLGNTGVALRDTVAKTINDGAIPIVLGGDHSLTYYNVIGASRQTGEAVDVLSFDAHSDIWDTELPGAVCDHGSWLSQAIRARFNPDDSQSGLHVGHTLIVGHRCLGPAAKVWKQYGALNIHALQLPDVASMTKTLTSYFTRMSNIWVTVDMDVFDPAYAPGVATPEPMGLTPHQLLPTIYRLCKDHDVIGIDVMETLPSRDPTGITALLASHVVLQAMLGFAARAPK